MSRAKDLTLEVDHTKEQAMSKRVVIIDKSQLSNNVFRLLLDKWKPTILSFKRFEEAREALVRKPQIDLMIFNSNSIGSKLNSYLDAFCDDRDIAVIPKIFLCLEAKREDRWSEVLAGAPNAVVLRRPFHPEELHSLFADLLERGGRS